MLCTLAISASNTRLTFSDERCFLGMAGVVIKIGTSSLTNEDGVIDETVIEKVAEEVADLRSQGDQVTIVTSGAIAAGMPVIGMEAESRPTDAVSLQALSSIGQPALMTKWCEALSRHDLAVGQILLAPHNFGERQQYLHARSTLQRLHQLGVIPVVNENDAVTDAEIRFGDNDRIAALVATLVEAETLVLLTDTDGLLTADPRIDPHASLIDEVVEFDQQLEELVGGAGTVRGSGGMASKLTAAKIAAWSGVRTVIANAERSGVIADAVSGTAGVGTVVQPRETTLTARKLWIGFAMPSVATVRVDEGALDALASGGKSLLSVGVAEVEGSFDRRNPIEISGPDGTVFAKGIARLSSDELDNATGQILVHADDLVVIA